MWFTCQYSVNGLRICGLQTARKADNTNRLGLIQLISDHDQPAIKLNGISIEKRWTFRLIGRGSMRRGRPMKYDGLLRNLDDERLYCPATIVQHALEAGTWILNPNTDESAQRQRLRVRHSLARYSRNHNFPFEGDGLLFMKGQAPHRGWYGWRWKADLT